MLKKIISFVLIYTSTISLSMQTNSYIGTNDLISKLQEVISYSSNESKEKLYKDYQPFSILPQEILINIIEYLAISFTSIEEGLECINKLKSVNKKFNSVINYIVNKDYNFLELIVEKFSLLPLLDQKQLFKLFRTRLIKYFEIHQNHPNSFTINTQKTINYFNNLNVSSSYKIQPRFLKNFLFVMQESKMDYQNIPIIAQELLFLLQDLSEKELELTYNQAIKYDVYQAIIKALVEQNKNIFNWLTKPENILESLMDYSLRTNCAYFKLEFKNTYKAYEQLFKNGSKSILENTIGKFWTEIIKTYLKVIKKENLVKNVALNPTSFNNYDALFGFALDELLKTGLNINAENFSSQTLLMVAVKTNNYPLVKLLLKKGADTSARDFYGRVPLIYAIISNNKNRHKIIKLLFEHGAHQTISVPDEYEQTAIDYLISKSRKDHRVLKFFKLDPNRCNKKQQTLLMNASKTSDCKTVESLLKQGANVNAVDDYGKTALIHAINSPRANRYKIVKLLFDYGAESTIYVRDSNDLTALDYLLNKKKKDKKLVQFLAKQGYQIDILEH